MMLKLCVRIIDQDSIIVPQANHVSYTLSPDKVIKYKARIAIELLVRVDDFLTTGSSPGETSTLQ